MEKIRISEMTDRDYHRYKAIRQKKLTNKNRFFLFLFVFSFSLTVTLAVKTLYSSANTGDDLKYKYYKVISVAKNDTLWDIAEEYADEAFYGSKEEYINEVIKINHLNNSSMIFGGQKLTIPYFSDQFVY